MKVPNGRREIEAAFGSPARADGRLDEAWEGANIRKIAPPDGWQLYYQSDSGLVRVSGIRLHRLVEGAFLAAMDAVWAYAKHQVGPNATDEGIRLWLHRRRLDQHGGGFNFRRITGGRQLSLHSYGIAIDWDPAHNPRRLPLTRTLPDWWYAIWRAQGWSDGRRFAVPDPMHLQFATGA